MQMKCGNKMHVWTDGTSEPCECGAASRKIIGPASTEITVPYTLSAGQTFTINDSPFYVTAAGELVAGVSDQTLESFMSADAVDPQVGISSD